MAFVNRKRNNDSEHFKKVFDDYFDAIVCFALKYIDNLEIAEDIVQESFIELWHSKIISTNTGHEKAFLYLTTRNKALNYLKHKKVTDNYILQHKDHVETERFYLDQLIEQETIDLLHIAIGKLPQQSKKVIELKLNGLKNSEIAEEIGITVETVKYHKSRAFRILKKYLQDRMLFFLPFF
jgi:RNA polymerase sigma-70 factor (ECF subfamily)